MDGGQDGLYLYCLMRSVPAPIIAGQGVDDESPPFLHTFGDIAAVVSTVPLKDFCGESAEERLKNYSWVGPKIFRHEAVIEEVMSYSQVIPARFGTIFSSGKSLDDLLRLHENVILGFFEETAGMTEWAVKGLLNWDLARKTVTSMLLEKENDRILSLPPGKRYFEEKRMKLQTDTALKDWLRDVSRIVRRDLMSHASRFHEREILEQIRDKDMEVIINWAFLVRDGSLNQLKDHVIKINKYYRSKGLVFELSGPWPPYSFYPPLEME
jgi:hypothetical protein